VWSRDRPLYQFETVEQKLRLSVGNDGEADWLYVDTITENSDLIEIDCPECDGQLFLSESEAVAFLKGEPVPAQ